MDPGAPNDLEASLYPPDPALLDPLASKGLPETQKTGEAPSAVGAAEDLSTYTFSRRRLNPVQKDSSREPLVLVACGQSCLGVWFFGSYLFDMEQDPSPRSHIYICGCLRWRTTISSSTPIMK